MEGSDPGFTTLFIEPKPEPLAPALTPPQGIKLVAGERRLGHGINNLLTVMFGEVQLLEASAYRLDHVQTSIASLKCCLMRMTELVRTSMASHRPVRTSLCEHAHDAIGLFKNVSLNRRIRLVGELSQQVWVHASPAAILDAITNLIANSIEAMTPTGGILTVETMKRVSSENGRDLSVLSVRDTGCGMTEETARRLGNEAFTLKPTGNGIGMLTVFATLAECGGSLSISTRLGKGTTIELIFPAAA